MKDKDPAARALGQRRWEKMTETERKEHIRRMIAARKPKKPKTQDTAID